MTALMAVLCAAASAFLSPKGTNPATQRLSRQFQRLRVSPPSVKPYSGLAVKPHQGSSGTGEKGSGHEGSGNVRGDGAGGGAGAPRRNDVLLRRVAAGAVGALCLVTLGGPAGALTGMVAAVAVWYSFGRSENAERRRRRARLVADLPVAVDLLAACLRGGAPWHDAVTAVADAVGGPLGKELQAVSAQIRLGADPAEAWLALAEEPTLAPLARTATRAASTGAALAPTLSRLARDQRRVARSAAAARARAAGIRALAPLGLCFLPAFVLLGVVPAVAGIASTILIPR